jgi:hypothetical protein
MDKQVVYLVTLLEYVTPLKNVQRGFDVVVHISFTFIWENER